MKISKHANDESGMTLVEILAAFVILTILIVSFFALFGQTALQNKHSEKTMDATYIAQRYMEDIYHISKTSSDIYEGLNRMNINYELVSKNGDEKEVWIFRVSDKRSKKSDFIIDDKYDIEIHIYSPGDFHTGNLLVMVYDANEKSKLQAQMETVLLWRWQ